MVPNVGAINCGAGEIQIGIQFPPKFFAYFVQETIQLGMGAQ